MTKWTDREISRLKMILETERSHSVHEMAKNAQQTLRKRSLTAIIHKLNELISQEAFKDDFVIIDGETFAAQVVSGYIVITLPDGTPCPAHHYVWSKHYGEIPSGYHIHHRNSKRTDNRIQNLALMSARDHIAYHQKGTLPETAALFWFLQEKGLWIDYLQKRQEYLAELVQ